MLWVIGAVVAVAAAVVAAVVADNSDTTRDPEPAPRRPVDDDVSCVEATAIVEERRHEREEFDERLEAAAPGFGEVMSLLLAAGISIFGIIGSILALPSFAGGAVATIFGIATLPIAFAVFGTAIAGALGGFSIGILIAVIRHLLRRRSRSRRLLENKMVAERNLQDAEAVRDKVC